MTLGARFGRLLRPSKPPNGRRLTRRGRCATYPLSVAEFWLLLWSVATNRERWAQALSAVTAAVEGFEDTMNVVEDRITFMEESVEAGIGDRCEGDRHTTQTSVLFNLLMLCAWRIGIESEVQSISSIVLAMKSGQVGFPRSADCHDFPWNRTRR